MSLVNDANVERRSTYLSKRVHPSGHDSNPAITHFLRILQHPSQHRWNNMSGQRSSSHGGSAASVAAGCTVSESSISAAASGAVFGPLHTRPEAQWPGGDLSMGNFYVLGGLAVFSWGRGEDGQLGIGDTR